MLYYNNTRDSQGVFLLADTVIYDKKRQVESLPFLVFIRRKGGNIMHLLKG